MVGGGGSCIEMMVGGGGSCVMMYFRAEKPRSGGMFPPCLNIRSPYSVFPAISTIILLFSRLTRTQRHASISLVGGGMHDFFIF